MLLVNPERLLWRFSDRTIESSLHGRVFDAFWLCLETSTWSCTINSISLGRHHLVPRCADIASLTMENVWQPILIIGEAMARLVNAPCWLARNPTSIEIERDLDLPPPLSFFEDRTFISLFISLFVLPSNQHNGSSTTLPHPCATH